MQNAPPVRTHHLYGITGAGITLSVSIGPTDQIFLPKQSFPARLLETLQ